MNNSAADSIKARLQQMEQWLTKRDAAVTSIYGSLFIAAFALFVLFPFPLSRVGSVVLIIGFAYMVWRCKLAPPAPSDRGELHIDRRGELYEPSASLTPKLLLLDKQIQLARTMLYNVPFFVGANLFWMGLPGTGSDLEKAVQDFVFLGGTLLALMISYACNQRLIRKQLLPLREDLIQSETKSAEPNGG